MDDDPALLSALEFTLELEGFDVSIYGSPHRVRIEDLPTTDGCLVLDYLMPGQTGLDLLAWLRASAVTLPAILITSHAKPEIRRRADSLGATIVEKPLLQDELLDAIHRAVALSR